MNNKLEYKGYTGCVEFDDEFQYLHGKVLGLSNDLIMYEGTTVTELVEDFRGAIDDYLASCEANGDQPERPFKGVFNVRVGSKRHQAIAMEAESNGISMNAMLNRILDEHYATA